MPGSKVLPAAARPQKGLASLSYSALERLRNWDIGKHSLNGCVVLAR